MGLTVLLLAGCGSQGKIMAVINGQVITERDVDQRMSRLNLPTRTALGNDRRRLLEEMIMESLLIQEARRRGLEQDREVRLLLKEAQRQILLGRLLEVVRAQEQAKVTDEAVAQFYEQNQERFKEPETFRASHLLVETEEEAKKAMSRIQGGEPFVKVAQEVSKDPSKARGGDIGYFTKGQLIPEFEAVCQKLKPGESSGIVKSSLGYHIILLTEQRESRVLALEEVRDQIRNQLAVARQQQRVESFVQELRGKAQIKIHEPAAAAPVSAGAPLTPPAAASQPANP